MSIDKAAVVIGVGRAGVRRIPTDESLSDDPRRRAGAGRSRRTARQGWAAVLRGGHAGDDLVDQRRSRPQRIAEICKREGLWLHLDAAYAAIRGGHARDATPLLGVGGGGLDRRQSRTSGCLPRSTPRCCCSATAEKYRDAFSIVPPEYLRTPVTGLRPLTISTSTASSSAGASAPSSCGCRSAGSVWRGSLRGCASTADWHRGSPSGSNRRPVGSCWPRCLSPRSVSAIARTTSTTRRSTVTTRHCSTASTAPVASTFHTTRLDGRYTLRIALGNTRATEAHVRGCWDLLSELVAP